MPIRFIYYGFVLVCYLVGSVAHWSSLSSRRRTVQTVGMTAVISGFSFQTILMAVRAVRWDRVPLTNLYEWMTFFSWAIILIYLLVYARYRLRALGAFLIPLAFLSLAFVGLSPQDVVEFFPPLGSVWLVLHIIFAFLGNAAFALTFGVGIMYLFQHRQLKTKKFGSLYYRLPSLEMLDQLNYRSLVIGFPLLTVGMVMGGMWALETKGTLFWDLQRVVPQVIAWAIYAVLFWGRVATFWRGKKAALGSVLGFVVVVLGYLLHTAGQR